MQNAMFNIADELSFCAARAKAPPRRVLAAINGMRGGDGCNDRVKRTVLQNSENGNDSATTPIGYCDRRCSFSVVTGSLRQAAAPDLSKPAARYAMKEDSKIIVIRKGAGLLCSAAYFAPYLGRWSALTIWMRNLLSSCGFDFN